MLLVQMLIMLVLLLVLVLVLVLLLLLQCSTVTRFSLSVIGSASAISGDTTRPPTVEIINQCPLLPEFGCRWRGAT